MICVSCKSSLTGKFCSNCGEKSGTPKITFKSTIHSSLTTITNMDKGFLYNIKNLTIKPKVIVQEYINGKRKGIFNPISFLIISITAYLILESVLKPNNIATQEQIKTFKEELSFKIGSSGGQFIKDYFKFFWILNILPLSILTKIFFKRFNLAEHITINSFILGYITLIFGSISLITFKYSLIFNPVIYIALIWYIYRVFHDKNEKLASLLIAALIVLLFILSVIAFIISIGAVKLYIN